MSVNWTEQQLEAIETRGGNILVAAAAGSGKTAVLVERIIRMITDEKDPVSIDRLLVLTFTDAAAAEMKRKISAAVDKKLEELPDNEWLRQQSLRVGSACISTIHSFCRRIITNNAHLTDLPSGFSMIDDTENSVLKARAADEVLEKFYSRIDSQQGFFDLVTGFGGIKNDNTLREVILKMYEFIQSLAYPNRWFDYVRKSYRGAYLGKGVEETVWYKPITELIKSYASDISDIMDILYGIAEKEFMPDNYHTVYFNTVREGFKSSSQTKDTDSKDTDDDDWDVKETETTYMTYDVFEPEKGTIKKSYAKPYEEYKTVLLETVKFSGKYKKTEKTDLYKTLAADGESITGVLKHYSGGDTTHFFTLTLTGPRDSVTLWKYMLTKEMTSEKTTKNLLRFSIYGRVENGKAYNYYGRKEPNMESYQLRGAVNDNKLTKIGFEVWETSTTMLGTMTADSVEYEMESAAKSDDYGKWLIKLFSAARGSLNTSMLGMRKEYWGLTKEESITQNGGYYDEDGNQHSVMRNWNNLAIKGTRYEYGKIIDKIEINVPQSLKGISTDGNTKFEMFLMEEKIIDDATDTVKKVIDDLVLKVSGNSGTKYYRQGDSVWRQPEGMTSSVGGNVGSNQSYTGWREVKKVNGLWELEFVDTASMTANFSDKARTGISSFEFNFNDETLKFGLDEIDYVGPLLNFFYMDAINDDTDTIAKALGLFPEDLKGLRK